MDGIIDEFDLLIHVVVRSPQDKGLCTVTDVINIMTSTDDRRVYIRRDGREVMITFAESPH